MSDKTKRKCGNCLFYGDSGAGITGYCLWGVSMPPVLREILSAAEAEPAAQIKHTVFDGMEISTDEFHCCSGWQSRD
jgi:hypothetical protein